MSCPKKPARSPPPPRVPQPTGVSHLQDQEHFQRLITAHRLVVVDFSAPWCGPCKMMKPIMNQLAEDFPDVTFAELDVDELTYLANENKISALPTFLFFKNGVRLDQMVGARPDLLKEKVASNK